MLTIEFSKTHLRLGSLCAGLFFSASPVFAASGQTLHVANTGADTAACGSASSPCRSITQAVANAASGATIIVGPGRYGDLNRDGQFDGPGEEHSAPGGDRRCGLTIAKPLAIYSRYGAQVTSLDAGFGFATDDFDDTNALVCIQSDGVTFGGRGRGFTLEGTYRIGLLAIGADLRIAGNIASGTFAPNIRGGILEGIHVSSQGGMTTVTDNISTGFLSDGFTLINDSTENGTTMVVSDNTALGILGTGFNVERSLGGTGRTLLTGNIASNNSSGFSFSASAIVRDNTASNNIDTGVVVHFETRSGTLSFSRNTIVGNGDAGFLFYSGSGASLVTAELHQNNIFGNDAVSGNNCGVQTSSIDPEDRNHLTVDATNNFWGAPTGPGPDPADNAGPASGCDPIQTTTVVPFAAQAFPVKPVVN
jgi:parallel beta-helix repeat protein